MRDFISSYVEKIIPLCKEPALSSWEANVTGPDETWARNEKATGEKLTAKYYASQVVGVK